MRGGTASAASTASAFQRALASMASSVSKVCAFSSCPGTLWARVPASMRVSGGAPDAVSSVKASQVEAATPGRSS